ncbi:hypothetical protein Sgleb_65210 [Streptomyces glebosus]|uniref:DUF4232 domain-containing protein n=1 Tax=Streptomyces glebosus TaxID=249580 RepID=A0A640T5H7_9ACTN|nr:DUF4232 domain-containing protein [Streptomyces glebosus]GFE18474.1 hypothetical protein Sgleb_65210 [Streptomyces glebosus]GHG58937.1 hypothetical protein GCM10010513_23440 [Streptomyces glebosus]
MRTIRSRTAAAATAVVLAGLSLTACESDSDAASGAQSAARPESGAPSQPGGGAGGTGKADGEGSGSGSGSSSGQGASSGQGKGGGKTGGGAGANQGAGSGSSGACTGANVKVVVSKVKRPINHLLLTITNSGSRACDAYSAPLLGFDDDQSVTRIIEDSKPQSVVTVAPGRSAYAAIQLSGEPGGDTHGRTAQRLSVHFAPRNGSGSVGTPAKLTLPANTHKDDNAAVTYWQSSASDALTY